MWKWVRVAPNNFRFNGCSQRVRRPASIWPVTSDTNSAQMAGHNFISDKPSKCHGQSNGSLDSRSVIAHWLSLLSAWLSLSCLAQMSGLFFARVSVIILVQISPIYYRSCQPEYRRARSRSCLAQMSGLFIAGVSVIIFVRELSWISSLWWQLRVMP